MHNTVISNLNVVQWSFMTEYWWKTLQLLCTNPMTEEMPLPKCRLYQLKYSFVSEFSFFFNVLQIKTAVEHILKPTTYPSFHENFQPHGMSCFSYGCQILTHNMLSFISTTVYRGICAMVERRACLCTSLKQTFSCLQAANTWQYLLLSSDFF
jgi:hypothetical protein